MSTDQPDRSTADSTQRSIDTENVAATNLQMQVGKYRLLERIGEGGMGEVYVAEQREPYYREVAVKLIKSDTLNSDGIQHYLARFDAERQALAMMNHPNIAKVIDGGATALAGPYIVMELCRGKTLIDYCQKNLLDLSGRLELFLQVCSAVEHAHQKGIIHRDLKPSNIIVHEADGLPSIKVIDFGLAKALQPAIRLTDKTLHTRNGVFLGTYKYTSPEQAAAENEDIDTRSDVFSLGIILYELLTDTTPIDDQFISSHQPSEILRVIREVEPSRPSSVKRNQTTQSTRKSYVLRHYTSALRYELDWITLKAIRKERNLRYQTVSAFAEDVRNFLRHEPVNARPPSQLYRLRKFASRNRAFVSAVMAIFLATSITAIGLSIAYQKSRQKEQIVGELLVTQQKLVKEELEKNEVLKKANLEIEEALKQQRSAQVSSKIALEQLEKAKAVTEQVLEEQTAAVRRQEQSIIQEAATAMKAGIHAWSKGDRQTASELLLQSLRLNPKDKSTQAWLYAILADRANFPSQSPDLIFGGNGETKRTLLSRDGSVILCQQTDNKLRFYSVAALMKEGIEKAQRGKTFTIDSAKYVFDIFRDANQNSVYILTGDTPSKSKKPCISVWRYKGEAVERISSFQPATQFYTEPFFGPSGEWYVARGGDDYFQRSIQNYSIVDSASGKLIQNFLNIVGTDSFAISPDGSQIVTTGIASSSLPNADLRDQKINQSTSPVTGSDGQATAAHNVDGILKDLDVAHGNASTISPVLFNLRDNSLSVMPLLSQANLRVGFNALGGISFEHFEYYRQRAVQETLQMSYSVQVPVTVQEEQKYNILVPVEDKVKDGIKAQEYVVEERSRVVVKTEMRTEERTKQINEIKYANEKVSQKVLQFDRDQAFTPYVATELGTFLFNRSGAYDGSLQEMSDDPIVGKLNRFAPSSLTAFKPNQIQLFTDLNAIALRYPGEFQIFRLPSSAKLRGSWPVIPWASFQASPFEETHAQPKFDATINLNCDAIAIPMSVNTIHLYRLSASLPALPAPFYPETGEIHFRARSDDLNDNWLVTVNSAQNNRLSLTKISSSQDRETFSIQLGEDIKTIGEVFICSNSQRLVLSDYVPPKRPGFCIDGCGTLVVPNQIILDANGSPQRVERLADVLDSKEALESSEISSKNGNTQKDTSSSERSLLVPDDALPSQPTALADGKSISELYEYYPMGNFWVISFPEGKAISSKMPGIIAATTEKDPLVLVRNFNRLYFYDVDKLAWLREPIQFGAEVTACTYSRDGKMFAVGTKNGEAIWFERNSFSEVGRFQLDDEIVELEFSPSNTCLAIQTSTYLPLPKDLESNRFTLLNIVNSKAVYSSQTGIQFRGFSEDSGKVLVQNQMVGSESFAFLDLKSPAEPMSYIFPPLAKAGLKVSFVNSDLVAVTEGRETWLYSCHWCAPVSPRFIHPDMDQDPIYIPEIIAIDQGEHTGRLRHAG